MVHLVPWLCRGPGVGGTTLAPGTWDASTTGQVLEGLEGLKLRSASTRLEARGLGGLLMPAEREERRAPPRGEICQVEEHGIMEQREA